MSDQLRHPQVGPDRMASLPSPGEAARLASFLQEHLRWSAFWDKGHGDGAPPKTTRLNPLRRKQRRGHGDRLHRRELLSKNSGPPPVLLPRLTR